MARDRGPSPALTAPPETDPEWREKIEAARQARNLGKKAREDKETTFRRTVGRSAGRWNW
jgi:hypothetical protein